jgi:hypothetical protein
MTMALASFQHVCLSYQVYTLIARFFSRRHTDAASQKSLLRKQLLFINKIPQKQSFPIPHETNCSTFKKIKIFQNKVLTFLYFFV